MSGRVRTARHASPVARCDGGRAATGFLLRRPRTVHGLAGITRRGRRLRPDDGQAVVEFGIVVPLLCVLVLVFVDFGRSLNYWLDMSHVASQGARLASVDADVTKAPYASVGAPTLQAYVARQLGSGELRNGSASVDAAAVAVCFPEGTAAGSPVTVQVRSTFRWLPLFGGSWPIEGKATMRLERDAANVTATGTCS